MHARSVRASSSITSTAPAGIWPRASRMTSTLPVCCTGCAGPANLTCVVTGRSDGGAQRTTIDHCDGPWLSRPSRSCCGPSQSLVCVPSGGERCQRVGTTDAAQAIPLAEYPRQQCEHCDGQHGRRPHQRPRPRTQSSRARFETGSADEAGAVRNSLAAGEDAC